MRERIKREVGEDMEVVMQDMPGLMIPVGSSTTTTLDDNISFCAWSPDINCVSGHCDDLHRLICSTKSDNTCTAAFAAPNIGGFDGPHGIYDLSCNTSTSTTITSSAGFAAEEPTSNISAGSDDEKRMRLVHLLMAAAEAISGNDKSRDLARVILIRLKELTPQAGAGATPGIERLTKYFIDALYGILDRAAGPRRSDSVQHHNTDSEVLTAFQLLQDMSPWTSFGHLTANQAILEAVTGEQRVHIVDYDVTEGIQWASLIQAMASRDAGSPPQHLKITAITNGSRRSASAAHEAGRRLKAFAASAGQPFSFRLCRIEQGKRFQPAAVKVANGEVVVANCVLHPCQHVHGSAASVGSFISGAAVLGARIVTVVEEEGGGGTVVGVEEKRGFTGRFMDEVERYMAVWESLEEGYPKQGRVREMVERVILGPRIAGAVRRAYGGNATAAEGCAEWMAATGFERMKLSHFNLCQARLLLGLFNDGYRSEEHGPNKLVLSWKSRQLLSASVWGIPTQLKSPSPWPAF